MPKAQNVNVEKFCERPFVDVKAILFTLSLKTDFDILYIFSILLSLAIHNLFA